MGRGKKRDIQYDSSSEEEVEDKSHLPPLVRKSDEAPPLSVSIFNIPIFYLFIMSGNAVFSIMLLLTQP